MAVNTILFDLDGTLLPMDQDTFTKAYFKALCKRVAPLGYDPDTIIKCIWAGTGAMAKNDGTKTNYQVFWDAFASVIGKDVLSKKDRFDEFYLKQTRIIRT